MKHSKQPCVFFRVDLNVAMILGRKKNNAKQVVHDEFMVNMVKWSSCLKT